MKKSDTWVFVQARFSSKRLPGKSLKLINGKPMLAYLLDRLLLTKLPVAVLVPQVEFHHFLPLKKKHPQVQFFGGNKFNVLKRFYCASLEFPARNYVRVTGDNPLTSTHCLMELLKLHQKNHADLSYHQGLPYGAGVEILSNEALHWTFRSAHEKYDCEHVTPWLHRHILDQPNLKLFVTPCPPDYHAPHLRVTVDTQRDFEQMKKWFKSKNFLSLKDLILKEREKS